MAHLNRISLIGNIGKDPEIRATQSGKKQAKFSLATTEKWRDKQTGESKESTEWHNVVAWGAQAEVIERLGLGKGTQLYIEGKSRTRSWDDPSGQKKYMTEVQMDAFQILSQKKQNDYEQRQPETNYNNDPEQDDMPF